MYKHLKETKENTENYKKWCFIKGLRTKHFEPIVNIFLSNLDNNEAYELEEKLIKLFGRKDLDKNGILTNICISSKPPNLTGYKMSKETKEKLRIACSKNAYWKGKVYPKELKDKISKTLKENHPMKGTNIYSIWIQKYGEDIAFKKYIELINKRISNNINFKHSDISIQKMKNVQKNANKGRVWIHKNNETKFIYPDSIDSFSNEGWKRGRK